jgi:hypothetical protein
MNVRESDITFNDDLEEENLIMIKEQTEDMDSNSTFNHKMNFQN